MLLVQVLHGSRSAHNLRDALDVVRFLSHSTEDDVLRHLWNLQYEPCWLSAHLSRALMHLKPWTILACAAYHSHPASAPWLERPLQMALNPDSSVAAGAFSRTIATGQGGVIRSWCSDMASRPSLTWALPAPAVILTA